MEGNADLLRALLRTRQDSIFFRVIKQGICLEDAVLSYSWGGTPHDETFMIFLQTLENPYRSCSTCMLSISIEQLELVLKQ